MAELQGSIKSPGVAALTVDFASVDKHAVKKVSHWFTADCALPSKEEVVIVIINTEHLVNNTN